MEPHSGSRVRTAIVIGGGLVGACCALALQDRSIGTTVLDEPSEPGPASLGNAGHIAIEQVAPLASLATLRSLPGRLFSAGGALSLPPREIRAWLPFSLRLLAASRPARFRSGKAALAGLMAEAVPAWRRLLHGCGAGELLIERGHLVVWESERGAAVGRAAWARADLGQARIADARPEEIELLSRAMVRPPAGAVRFEGTGQIADLDRLATTLRGAFQKRGGQVILGRVEGLESAEGLISVRSRDGVLRRADAVLVAAGIGSARLLRALGYHVPMIAERGYHLHAEASAWPIELPPVVFEERAMIVTRFRSGVRAASFVEFSGEEKPPDPRKWDRLRDHIRELGLPFWEPVAEWYGARPTLPDYLPALGRSSRHRNLFYAFGHQHLGLTLAAASAEIIRALVAGVGPLPDLSPFDLNRFQGHW